MNQQPKPTGNQAVYGDFDDLQDFESHRRLNKREMFDPDFLKFMAWFKKDIHSRYSRKDFQRLELSSIIQLSIGFIGMVCAYIYLHSNFPQYAPYWGVALFIVALFVTQKGEVMHMRAHSPSNLTGSRIMDEAIDTLGMPLTGISPGLFKRRHCAAHYNDIGNVSRIFSQVWITFDKVPVNYYLRPWMLVQFLLNKEFCREEMINRKRLLIETIGFYTYLGVMVTELFHGSYFLLVFHLFPSFILASSQVLSAVTVHSGVDKNNSFESNGLFDPATAKGLFKVPLYFFSLIGNGGVLNHGIHHAYPQVPLEIINKDFRRLNQHIMENYSNVRYNNVLSMRIHENLFARLGPPNAFDYVVAFFCSVIALLSCMFTVVGVPIPPTVFEPLLVDYRIYFVSTKAERYANYIAFWNDINIEERYQKAQNRNTYLQYVYNRHVRMKRYLSTHPVTETAKV